VGSLYSSCPILKLPAILFNPIQKIIEILSEFYNGLVEGYGAWKGTMLPSEASSSSSPSSSPSISEPVSNSESNPDLEKGSNKFAIISIFFLVLMLFPYLSDSSINESILPFIMVFKRSIKLPSLSLILSETSKDKLIFTFFTLLILYIITITINILPISETSNIESILISVSLFAKIKDIIIPYRPSTPDSLSDASIDRALDKEYSRLDGIYPNLSSLPNQGARTSTVTEIDYSGSVVDISPGSEWDILPETSGTVSTTSINVTGSPVSSDTCSTCPQVDTGSILDRSDVFPTRDSMIELIAKEETSSINLDNVSIRNSPGNSSVSISESASTESLVSSLGYVVKRRVMNSSNELIEASSTSLPDLSSQTSPSLNLESTAGLDLNRVRALYELSHSNVVPATTKELSEFYLGLPWAHQRWASQKWYDQVDESFIPFLLLSTNIISNKINTETLKNIMIYISSSILFILFLLLSVNITDLTDSPENALISVSMFTILKDKFLNRISSKPTVAEKSDEVIVNNSPTTKETLYNISSESVNEVTANNSSLVLETSVNSSSESVNEDWQSCRTHFSTESDTQSSDWQTCRESFSRDSPSDNCSISRSSPRERLHFSWNNIEQKIENGSAFIDPTTGNITEDHPALIEFNRALTYKKLFYSGNSISEDLIDESFLPFFLLFSNSLLSNKIKNSKLFIRIQNSKTFGYLKTSLLFKIFITSVLSLIIKYLILKLWSVSIDPITNIFIPLLAFYDPILLEAWSTRYFKLVFECFLPNSIHLDSVGVSDPHQDENVVKNKLRKFRKWIKKCIKSIKHRFDTDGDSFHTANSSLDSLILDEDYQSVLDWDLTDPKQALRFEMNRKSLPPVPNGYCDHADLMKYQEHLPAYPLTSNDDTISTRGRADSGIFPDGNPFTSRDRELNRLQNNNLQSRFSVTESAVTSVSDSDNINNNKSKIILKGMLKKALKLIKK
jgi:hypothetical protein